MTLKILYYSSYFWIPAILLFATYELWLDYVRALFFAKQTYILLEIKLPREMFKSPKAAEFFIAGLYNTLGEGNWFEVLWKGQVRASFSLEIVSIDGAVHFFIWTRKGGKNQIEANIYSQFPGVEIYEVPDYTLPINYDPEVNSLWATEFDLTGKDYFPIKTYIDYGMDKDPKEEFKIDPMTPLIEAMGALTRGNQAWLQIIIRAHKKEDIDPKTGEETDLRWKNGAQEEIDKIITKSKGEKDKEGKLIPGTGRPLTDLEKEAINALGRSVSKNGFDVGMRMIYTGTKDVFSMNNVGGLVGGIMHFNSPLNGFKPARGSAPKHKKLFAWKDRSPKKIGAEKQEMLDAYKKRAYFYRPHKRPWFVLNTEELATLYHFPGGVSTTPTFTRIESRKAEAPANLPIETPPETNS
ncbi:MAG: hypothetical protein ABL899_00450 [Nitrospira sp.]